MTPLLRRGTSCCGLAAAGGYLWLQREFHAPGPATTLTRIEVVPGATVRGVPRALR